MKVAAPLRPDADVPPSGSSAVQSVGGGTDSLVPDGSPRVTDLDARTEFRVLYDTWFEDVARWVRALGGLDADRDDIVQEVFLIVHRRLASFDGANPAGWLYRITRRQHRDFRRRTWVKHIFTRQRSDEPDALPHGGEGPVASLEQREKQRILRTLLQKMSDDQRSAFVLFEIDGLSGEEIARIQSIPVNTVWTRLHHARKQFFALAAKYQKTHGELPQAGPPAGRPAGSPPGRPAGKPARRRPEKPAQKPAESKQAEHPR